MQSRRHGWVLAVLLQYNVRCMPLCTSDTGNDAQDCLGSPFFFFFFFVSSFFSLFF